MILRSALFLVGLRWGAEFFNDPAGRSQPFFDYLVFLLSDILIKDIAQIARFNHFPKTIRVNDWITSGKPSHIQYRAAGRERAF